MADNKFTIEMHRENMRRIIRPKPAGLALDRIRQAVKTRRLPVTQKTKGIR